MRTCLIGVMLMGWSVTPAVAQEDFSHVKAKAGQRLIVTENGLSISGAVTEISPSRIVIEDHKVRPGPGLRIRRDNGNTVLRGMTIGAGIGAVTGLVGVRAGWGLLLAFPGAFWGSLAGAHSDQYTTLYDTTALTLTKPQLSLSSTPATTSPASSSAPDFSAAHVKVGQFVYVSDPEAKIEVSGRVTRITPSRIEIGAYAVEPKPGLKIERKGDTILDGAALGFLAGGTAGVTLGAESCSNTTGTRCFISSRLAGAVFGAYLDWRHVGRTTVYVAGPSDGGHSTRLIPSITPHARSMWLQFAF